jgi:hypothetical protein
MCKNFARKILVLLMTFEGLEPKMKPKFYKNNWLGPFSDIFEAVINIPFVLYPMWNDVRTYLTISFDTEEKNLMRSAISYFKKKEERK